MLEVALAMYVWCRTLPTLVNT